MGMTMKQAKDAMNRKATVRAEDPNRSARGIIVEVDGDECWVLDASGDSFSFYLDEVELA